jgi:hypothetical protein
VPFFLMCGGIFASYCVALTLAVHPRCLHDGGWAGAIVLLLRLSRSHCRRCSGAMTRSTLSIDSRDVVEDTLAGLREFVRSILSACYGAGAQYVDCSHPACARVSAYPSSTNLLDLRVVARR